MARVPEFEFVCSEANRLAGAGPSLYCVRCDREVHDLSAMTATESDRFLEGCRGTQLCVRYEREVTTGAIRHRPERVARRGHLGRVTLALGLGIGGLTLAQVSLRAPKSETPSAARPGAGGLGWASTLGPADRLQAAVEAALADAARRPVEGWESERPEADERLPDDHGFAPSEEADRQARANEASRPVDPDLRASKGTYKMAAGKVMVMPMDRRMASD